MLRHAWVLIGLAATSLAQAQIIRTDTLVSTRQNETRLLIVPDEWSPEVAGLEIRRRVAGGEWEVLGRTNVPQGFRQRDLAGAIDYVEFNRWLRGGFDRAARHGFGYVDRSPPAVPPTTEVFYAVHAISGGVVNPDAAEFVNASPYASAYGSPTAYVRQGVTVADPQGLQVAFGVDAFSFSELAPRYRLYEQRGDARQPLGGWRTPPRPGDWQHLCARPTQPWPDAVVLVAEDWFGFTYEIATPLKPDKAVPRQRHPDIACDSLGMAVPDTTFRRNPEPQGPRVVPAGMQVTPGKPLFDERKLLRGAILHLDANRGLRVVDGKVLQLTDLSGNGNDAVMDDAERRPSYQGGHPGRRATFRTGKWLTLQRPLPSRGFTIFVVGRHSPLANGAPEILLGAAPGHESSVAGWLGQKQFVVRTPRGKDIVLGDAEYFANYLHVLVLRHDGKTLSLRRNGKQYPPVPIAPDEAEFAFATLGGNGGGSIDGDVHAVVAFGKALDQKRIDDIVAHLTYEYWVYPHRE